jgi:hypothetical protein
MAKLFRQQKGQSAIEYLTTYGWMLLVIAIVGGAIFTTVQNSSQIQSTSGLANADVQIENFGVSGDNLQVELRAASSDQVENVNFSLTQQESSSGTVYADSEVTIPVGDTATVSVPGIDRSENTNTFDVGINYDTGGLTDLQVNGTLTGRLTAE